MAGKTRTKVFAEPEVDRLSNKEYAKKLKTLHVELVKPQQWAVRKGLKVCIVCEGRAGVERVMGFCSEEQAMGLCE